MRIKSIDRICRHLAAPGTRTDLGSQFGKHLKDSGVNLTTPLSLRWFVDEGWIAPVLRVPLPRTALDSWINFPKLNVKAPDCPESGIWAINLWIASHTVPPSVVAPGAPWALSYVDDPSHSVGLSAREHSVCLDDDRCPPEEFEHEPSGRRIEPWIDFFAYWQAFHVAELCEAACMTLYATAPPANAEEAVSGAVERARARMNSVRQRWHEHRTVFEWLSHYRTMMSNWNLTGTGWETAELAAKSLASDLDLSTDAIRHGIRDTLLVIWARWTSTYDSQHQNVRAALRALRDDIDYAVTFLEMLTGEETDPQDSFWHIKDRQARRWAQLVDALPREQWIARCSFPESAASYLVEESKLFESTFPFDVAAIEKVVSTKWQKSRALRRFCFASSRLHDQLDSSPHDGPFNWRAAIQEKERIEQLLLLPLHGERILSQIHRSQPGSKRFPEVRELVRGRLDRALVLTKCSGADRRNAIARAKELMKKAQLHAQDWGTSKLFVDNSDVELDSAVTRRLVAAHVNFVIARNYAAHHDALDDDLVFATDGDPTEHVGRIAMTSVLTTVLAAMRDLI